MMDMIQTDDSKQVIAQTGFIPVNQKLFND